MKLKDLKGQKFGKLTVISREESKIKSDKRPRTMWMCECECGNYIIADSYNLLGGHTKSCGCLRNNRFVKRNDINFIGKTFGYLTVIEKDDGKDMWLCQCNCGNITTVKGYNLTSGNTKSCGCYQKQRCSNVNTLDLTNIKFGKLLAIKPDKKTRFGHTTWFCKCDCGGTAIVTTINLKKGIAKSCGCVKSNGEQKINEILTNNKIRFQPQYSVKDFKYENSKRCGIFDFAVFSETGDLSYLIEYDGAFHFGYTNQGWNTESHFKNIKSKDDQKNKYCLTHNIPLIRIPYTHYENLSFNDLCVETTKFLLKTEE